MSRVLWILAFTQHETSILPLGEEAVLLFQPKRGKTQQRPPSLPPWSPRDFNSGDSDTDTSFWGHTKYGHGLSNRDDTLRLETTSYLRMCWIGAMLAVIFPKASDIFRDLFF